MTPSTSQPVRRLRLSPPIASTARTKRRHTGHCDMWTATTRCSPSSSLPAAKAARNFRGVMRDCHFGSSSKPLRRFIASLILDLRCRAEYEALLRSPDAADLPKMTFGSLRIARWRKEYSARSARFLFSPGDLRFLRVGRGLEVIQFRISHATPRADRRTASIRRLRAIVNIQAGAPADAGSNCAAFRHTASSVSWLFPLPLRRWPPPSASGPSHAGQNARTAT